MSWNGVDNVPGSGARAPNILVVIGLLPEAWWYQMLNDLSLRRICLYTPLHRF